VKRLPKLGKFKHSHQSKNSQSLDCFKSNFEIGLYKVHHKFNRTEQNHREVKNAEIVAEVVFEPDCKQFDDHFENEHEVKQQVKLVAYDFANEVFRVLVGAKDNRVYENAEGDECLVVGVVVNRVAQRQNDVAFRPFLQLLHNLLFNLLFQRSFNLMQID
jgi:hypothetical protein